MYRYKLEKYNGPASRHTCPGCGRKREFTRYVDTVTGEYVSGQVGKCNRAGKCKYHYTPAQYFADNQEPGRLSYVLSHRPKVIRVTVPAVPEPIGTIDRRYLIRSIGTNSYFITWLLRYFDKGTVLRAVDEYAIGYTRDGRTIFWQQDIKGNIRTGQVMRYDTQTGRRVKGRLGSMDWIHAILKRKGELPADFNLRQCLFGEHLLTKYPEATVILVESAKSAVVCSALLPEFLWCATDGIAGFSAERCRPLAGRKVIVIPDMDAHEQWSAKAPTIARQISSEIAISDFLVRLCTPQQYEAGYDIADYIIDQLDDGVPQECIADKIREAIGTFYLPDCLTDVIAGITKEPFKNHK